MDRDDPNGQMPEELAGDVERPAGGGALDTLPSSGLLSFYDRLRERVVHAAERQSGKLGGGKLGRGAASALLLVPDVFILVARLAMDKEVPKSTRTVLAGALAYFVLPLDLMPEAVVGPGGFLDDLVLALAVLAQAFGKELEPYAEKYWSGSQSLRTTLSDVLTSANSLLGTRLYDRVRALLAKKGVEIEQPG